MIRGDGQSPRGRARIAWLVVVAFLIVVAGGVYGLSRLTPQAPASKVPPADQFTFRVMWPAEADVGTALSAAERATLLRVCIDALQAAPMEKVDLGLANTPPPPGTVGLRMRFLRGFDVARNPDAIQLFIANRPMRVSELFLARVPSMTIPGGRGVVWAQTDLGRVLTRQPVALEPQVSALLTRLLPANPEAPQPVKITLWRPDGRPVLVSPDSEPFRAIAAASEALAPLNQRTLAAATESTFTGGNLPPAWMVNPTAVTVAVTYDQPLTDPKADGAADTVLLADAKSSLPESSLIAAVGPWGGDLWRTVPVDAAAVAHYGPALHAAVVSALNASTPAGEPQMFAPANSQLTRSIMAKGSRDAPPDPAALGVVIEACWYAIRWLPVDPKIVQMEPNGLQITWKAPVTLARQQWPKSPIPFHVFRCSVWFPNDDMTKVRVRFESSLGELVLDSPLTKEPSATTVRAALGDAIKKLNSP